MNFITLEEKLEKWCVGCDNYTPDLETYDGGRMLCVHRDACIKSFPEKAVLHT